MISQAFYARRPEVPHPGDQTHFPYPSAPPASARTAVHAKKQAPMTNKDSIEMQ